MEELWTEHLARIQERLEGSLRALVIANGVSPDRLDDETRQVLLRAMELAEEEKINLTPKNSKDFDARGVLRQVEESLLERPFDGSSPSVKPAEFADRVVKKRTGQPVPGFTIKS